MYKKLLSLTNVNLIRLIFSNAGAQAIAFMIYPLISRVFTVEEFGVFGSISAISAIMIAVGPLKLEVAVMLEKSNSYRSQLLVFCVFLVAEIALFFLFFGSILGILAPDLNIDLNFLIMVASVYSANTLLILAIQWLNYNKLYKNLSATVITKSVAVSLLQLLFGVIGLSYFGLVLGAVVGCLCSIVYVLYSQRATLNKACLKLKRSTISRIFKDHRDFIFYCAPKDLLNACSSMLPILLFTVFFNQAMVGAYFFGVKIIQIPAGFFGEAIKNIVLQKIASESTNKDLVLALCVKYTFVTLAACLPIIVLIFFFGPQLFQFIFGDDWGVAGQFSSWIVIWVASSLSNISAMQICYVYGYQKFVLYFEILQTIARSLVLAYGCLYLEPLGAIKIFSICGVVFNAILIASVLLYFKSKLQSNTKHPLEDTKGAMQ